MKNKPLASILLVVFIDLLGFSLILPLLPYYAKTFNASDILIGLLISSYAAMQLVGAPLLGRLSDRYGRRLVLLISIFGTLIGFLLLGFARTLWMLFVSRIVDGFTGGNISVAQAYISDVTDARDRARGLGMVGAAFGLGFIIGPVTGGVLSQWGYAVPAFAAAGLAMLNLILVAVWLPESLTAEMRSELQVTKTGLTASALITALKRPFSGPLLITRFFFGLAFAVFQTIFSLHALTRFQLSATQTGYILTYVGVLLVFVQGFLVGRLTRFIREDILIVLGVGVMAFSLLGWALAPNIPVLLVILIPIAISGGVLNTLLNSTLTKVVGPQEVGGILGLSASIESLTRVLAPTLGGALLGAIGVWSPGAFGALLLTGLTIYIWRALANPSVVDALEAEIVNAS